jgi:hypothetical protein
MQMKTISGVCALAISILAGCAPDGGDAPAKPATAATPTPVAAPCTDCNKAPAKAAVDSTIAWRHGKEQDLSEAQAFASRAQSMKIPVIVKTARAQKRDDAFNKTEQLDVVKNVVLRPLALDKLAKSDKIWAEVIRQLGKYAAQANAHEPQQIVVSVTSRTKARVTQWLTEGVASANNNQKPDIQVFETTQAKDTAIFYQPLDQKQFVN